jgi:hypothetical protein
MHFTPLVVVLSSIVVISASPVPNSTIVRAPKNVSNVASFYRLEQRYTPGVLPRGENSANAAKAQEAVGNEPAKVDEEANAGEAVVEDPVAVCFPNSSLGILL